MGAWSSWAGPRARRTSRVVRRGGPASTAMQAEAASPQLGWSLVHDVREVLEYHVMVNALLAGTVVALIAGLVGWVMVVRRQVFAGHTLAMMAFPGASSAALLGVPGACGYAVWCGAAAGAISLPAPATPSWGERTAR